MRIIIISHHLAFEQYQVRWEQLANEYPDIEIRALIPEIWESSYYQGGKQRIITTSKRKGKFEVFPVSVTDVSAWWKYEIIGLEKEIKIFQPDVVFAIADEFFAVTQQCARIKKKLKSFFKLIIFSTHACIQLRNAADLKHKIYYQHKWRKIKNKVDVILCHYPQQEEYLRSLKFKGLIGVQTQVGIDMDVFKPDNEMRIKIRKKFCWEDQIIGFAGRMIRGKGIFTLFDACKDENWHLVYLGSGPDCEALQKYIKKTQHRCKVEFIAKVPALEVGNYLNAMDIFYTGSLTLKDWEDTFPNAVCQAQACQVPVVVSDSCALPYLAGEQASIFHEGNAQELHDCLAKLLCGGPEQMHKLAMYGYERCKKKFSTRAINEQFYRVINEVVNNDI